MTKTPVTISMDARVIQRVRAIAGAGKPIALAEFFEAAIEAFFELNADERVAAIQRIREPELREAIEGSAGEGGAATAAKKGKRAG